MKKSSIAFKFSLAAAAFGLLASLPAMAQTPPVLLLTDGINTLTIAANGVPTDPKGLTILPGAPPTANCACSTVSVQGVSTTAGTVMWTGTIGSFTVMAEGQSGAASPDLAVVATNTGSTSGTLTVSWTSTGYTGAIVASASAITGITGGTGSVTYNYYADLTNALFGQGSPITSLLNVNTNMGTAYVPTATTATSAYSLTEVEAITLGPNATLNGDNYLYTAPAVVTVQCMLASGTTGTPYSSGASAQGGTPPYTFSVVAPGVLPGGLSLNATSGAITGTPNNAVGSPFTFTIQAVDSNGIPATSGCSIAIGVGTGGGQNGLTLSCPSTTGLTQGAYYSSAFVATGGVGTETFSISAGKLPAGLKYNAVKGTVYGTPTGTGPFSFTGSVIDSDTPTKQTATTVPACTGTIAPKPAPLSLTCASKTGTVGTPYSSAVVASGGTAPYGPYSLATPNTLPPGLTLDPKTGIISGTPTKAGTYSYTVIVLDANGVKASDGSGSGRCSSSGCSITIAGPPPLTLKCPTSTAKVGVAYSSPATVVGGTAPFKFTVSAGSLPKGLSIDPVSGIVSGTPTTSGTSDFTLKVTDSTGKSDDTSDCAGGCSITVAPSITITCPTSSATLNKAYSSTPTVTGGTPNYTWSITSGSLPPGLTLNTSTGAITGTPTKAGTYSIALKVVDSKGLVGVSSCGSCSTGSSGSSWGSGWGWWGDDDGSSSGSTTNCNCTITVVDPNANSNCGTGTDGYGSNSGWGWGW